MIFQTTKIVFVKFFTHKKRAHKGTEGTNEGHVNERRKIKKQQ
jgi:hypothetical protein